jgi:hypothetical protein
MAKTMTIDFTQVRDAQINAIMLNPSLSEYQKNILVTLAYTNPLWLIDLGIEKILKKGESSIILLIRKNTKTITVEIKFNLLTDFYDLKFISGLEEKEIVDVDFENLYSIIKDTLRRLGETTQ